MYLRYGLVLVICICCGLGNLKADWANICPSMTARMVHTVVSSGNDLFAATIEGVYYSSDKGLSWELRKNGMNNTMAMAAAISGNNVIIGTSGAGVYYSSDKGVNWHHADLGDEVFDIYCLSEYNGKVYAGHYSGISVSEDNGKTWADMEIGDYSVYSLAFEGDIIIAGAYKNILSYSDGQWTDISGSIAGNEVLSLCSKGNIIYAATEKGLFATIDMGKVWKPVAGMLTDMIITKIMKYDSLLFIITENEGIYFTKNGGYSWLQCVKGLPELMVQSVNIFGDMVLAGTDNFGIYKEDLTNFTSVNDFPPSISEVYDLVSPPNRQVSIGFIVHDEYPEQLKITANSMIKTLFPNDGISIEGTGRYRTLRLMPAFGKTGSTLITLTVNDNTYTYSLNFNITVSESASVDELGDSCPVSMSYIPGGIQLRAKNASINKENVNVFDITGNNVVNKIEVNNFGNTLVLDMVNLSGGVYILTYNNERLWYYSKILLTN